jgi:hypothetical protein
VAGCTSGGVGGALASIVLRMPSDQLVYHGMAGAHRSHGGGRPRQRAARPKGVRGLSRGSTTVQL